MITYEIIEFKPNVRNLCEKNSHMTRGENVQLILFPMHVFQRQYSLSLFFYFSFFLHFL